MSVNGSGTDPGAASEHVQPQFSPVSVACHMTRMNGQTIAVVVFHTVLGPIHVCYDGGGLDQLVALLQDARANLRGGLIVPDVRPPDL